MESTFTATMDQITFLNKQKFTANKWVMPFFSVENVRDKRIKHDLLKSYAFFVLGYLFEALIKKINILNIPRDYSFITNS